MFLFFELSASFFKSVVESKANLPLFFLFCFPLSFVDIFDYFFVLVFLVATESKNSKVRIDVRIFKTFEFLSPGLITTFSAV